MSLLVGARTTGEIAARRRPLGMSAILVLLLAFSCGGRASDGGPLLQRSEPGPLVPPETEAPSENYSEFRAWIGEPFTFGLVFIKNYGDDPVVLDGVDLVDGTAGIEVVGLRAADITGERTWSSDEAYPPARPRDHAPLEGFEIGPNGTQVVQVLLGLELTGPGQHGFRSVAIRYHVGDRDYRYVYPSGVAACSHYHEPMNECDARLLFPVEP